MTSKTPIAIDPLIERLQNLEGYPVWSLIVTILGAMSNMGEHKISAHKLSEVTDRIGVKPDALRVAVHRLKKDGWIETEKSGRNSTYHLTKFGQTESKSAHSRIYPWQNPTPPTCVIAILPPIGSGLKTPAEKTLVEQGYHPLAGNLYVGDFSKSPPEGVFLLDASTASPPAWIIQKLTAPELITAYDALLEALRALVDFTKRHHPTDLDGAVLHILALHQWRRLVLRHPTLPASFSPSDFAQADCVKLLAPLLGQLPLSSLQD
ncbi:MAG: PaaX family transcriptional regulator C-terminal domain-containing protein [Halocynthiibacter sp.]